MHDELKQACGTQQYKTSHYATRLRLVTSFKDYVSHESNPKKETKLLKAKTSLSKAIDSLADALTKPTEGEAVQTLSERRSRAEKLRRKVCFFESRLSNETYKAFQGTDKKVIEDVVTNLGLQ
ncbi:hypothetical protein Lbir_2134 [Legionella birminghamensis]|uniref:Uncharacterized protein n=1 Tax=Legionella birminghamensis TaxID=28083 RepID=A0A378I941_9GAMM|nr:hypothetical protein [Legionella birminghamensis]KTC69395.1 hypothetical protein Lbir_2134 [Legionella birminghamensis]STX31659.1 Uncharacterised protein [Legionella birminghamensis]